MKLDRVLRIHSPEQIRFELPLAGLSSRFFASLLDFFCMLVFLIVLQMVLSVFRLPFALTGISSGFSLVNALAMVLLFLLQWGYFVAFDMLWNGQSPGKRVMKIRTLQQDGSPITMYQSAIRNLLRMVDALPIPIPLFFAMGYLVGFIAILCNRDNQRLGDLVAGTVVVRNVEWQPPQVVQTETASYYNTFRLDMGLRLRLQRELEKFEKEVLLDVALRAEQLALEVRFPLMTELARFLEERLRLQRPEFMSAEKFVLNIADALYAQEEEVVERLRQRQSKRFQRRASAPSTRSPEGTEMPDTDGLRSRPI